MGGKDGHDANDTSNDTRPDRDAGIGTFDTGDGTIGPGTGSDGSGNGDPVPVGAPAVIAGNENRPDSSVLPDDAGDKPDDAGHASGKGTANDAGRGSGDTGSGGRRPRGRPRKDGAGPASASVGPDAGGAQQTPGVWTAEVDALNPTTPGDVDADAVKGHDAKKPRTRTTRGRSKKITGAQVEDVVSQAFNLVALVRGKHWKVNALELKDWSNDAAAIADRYADKVSSQTVERIATASGMAAVGLGLSRIVAPRLAIDRITAQAKKHESALRAQAAQATEGEQAVTEPVNIAAKRPGPEILRTSNIPGIQEGF